MRSLAMGAVSLLSVMVAAQPSMAADKWYPAKVYDASSGKDVEAEYTPLEKAAKPYNICVLFPHMKDSYWVAVAYGLVSEAQDLGVGMNLYEAGGYENLPRQLSQFDDCLAAGVDAIIIGSISEAGVAQKFEEAAKKGIPVIAVGNPVSAGKLPAMIYADFKTMGGM
ncbi:substrate-binding domain-containing protein, partial [Pseudoxanthobacter sp.]|uniref:substrate-binding domain-containing protein n=1 Tax=Pseudoxanthobacter sp. TaxID=1925742 RepID=UPI002FDF7481